MAHVYGTLAGNRGEATRCGSKESGIRATVQTWKSILRSGQAYDDIDGRDKGGIILTTKHGDEILRLRMETDLLSAHRDHPAVAEMIVNLQDAMDELNDAAREAAKVSA